MRFYVINYLMTALATDKMELSLQSRARFVGFIFLKWSEGVSFLRVLVKRKFRYSFVRSLSTSSFKSRPMLSVFCDMDQLLDDGVGDR